MWIDQVINLVEFRIDRRIKIAINYEIAVQVYAVFVDLAVMFHPPGIDGMDEQQSGIFRIESRGEFFDEDLQHGRANIAFDAMLGGRDDDEIFFFAAQPKSSRWISQDGRLVDGFPDAHPAILTEAGSSCG